jgi:hypothetical protein
MKLNNFKPQDFQKDEDIYLKTDLLFLNYAEKNIIEILQDMIDNPEFIKINLEFINKKDNNSLNYKKRDVFTNFCNQLISSVNKEEKIKLLNDAIEKGSFLASILISHPDIEVEESKIDKILKSRKEDLIIALFQNKKIPLSNQLINDGLFNFSLVEFCIDRIDSPNMINKSTLTELVNDYHNDIIIKLLDRDLINIDNELMDKFLNSDDFFLRLKCSTMYDFKFTKKQILKGLNDEGFEYEAYDYKYDKFNPSDIIYNFIKNINIKIPAEFISDVICYKDKNYFLKELLERKDIILNEQEIDFVINKIDNIIPILKTQKLTDYSILKTFFKAEYTPKLLIDNYFSRDDIKLSNLVLNVLAESKDENVKSFLSNYKEKSQTNIGLTK